MSSESDATLVALARQGDRGALDALLRRHHDRIYALCRRMTGNDSDALDATQEALLAICRGLARFDGRSAFTTWMYRVTTNACLDELRRKSRRPTPVDDLAAFDRPGSSPALSESVADRHDIDAALSTLPDEFRAAVVLRDLCDLDYAEIASVLDIPPGTVRSRIARGRAAVALVLGPRPGTGPSPANVRTHDHD